MSAPVTAIAESSLAGPAVAAQPMAEKMLRYEALFELTEALQGSDTLATSVAAAARQLKYIANVSAWRLLVASNPGFVVADGQRGSAEAHEVTELSSWNARLWQTFLPARHSRTAFASDGDAPGHLRAAACGEVNTIPLERAGQAVGLIVASTRLETAAALDLKFLRMAGATLAEHLGHLVMRRRALEALERQAGRDALTGAMNRRAIIEALKKQLANARRTAQPLCVLMADVDHFKSVNDRFGHPAGDEVLRELARRIESMLREGDYFGRFGGEEFLFALHPCSAEGAGRVGERLRAGIANTPFLITSCGEPFELPVTISLGGACCEALAAASDEALVKLADAALYRSKHEGRNRVTMHSPAPPET